MRTRLVSSFFVSILALSSSGCIAEVEDAPFTDEETYVAELGLEAAADEEEPLKVEEGYFSAEASIKPWSSWWFPIWDDYLFKGRAQSQIPPLRKYDLFNYWFLRTRTNATGVERDELYQVRASSWEGLCDAWALASIMEPEPTQNVKYGPLVFTVADQKALLLKTYEDVPELEHVGERYDGRWNDDYADVYPHVLHRFLLRELFDKHLPFIMDHDASYEVWNVPVFKAFVEVKRDESSSEVIHVTTWLISASPHVDRYDYVGTKEESRQYTYDLGGHWEGSSFVVISGSWTGRSRWDHPDYLIPKPEKVTRKSRNREINVRTVDLILHGR